MAKTITKEEFGLWLEEHVEPTTDDIRGDEKTLAKWLGDLHAGLKAHAAEQAEAEAEEHVSIDDVDDELDLDDDDDEDDEVE